MSFAHYYHDILYWHHWNNTIWNNATPEIRISYGSLRGFILPNPDDCFNDMTSRDTQFLMDTYATIVSTSIHSVSQWHTTWSSIPKDHREKCKVPGKWTLASRDWDFGLPVRRWASKPHSWNACESPPQPVGRTVGPSILHPDSVVEESRISLSKIS